MKHSLTSRHCSTKSPIYFLSKSTPRTSQKPIILEVKVLHISSYRAHRSGSIVSDYGLDDRAIRVRSPAGAEEFSSILCVQTGSGAHPASCTMGTGGPFPGVKARPGLDADNTPPSSAEVVNE
jgi:hypothetical protein